MKVVVSSISSDSHTWNLIYMQLLMEEFGFDVVNLGSCVSYDELIKQCHHVKPDLLLVSTVNGHGFIEGENIAEKLKNYPMLRRMKSVIGGKLSTKGAADNEAIDKLYAAGFDGVFMGEQSIPLFKAFLIKHQLIMKETA